MLLVGRIFKEGKWWVADLPVIGVATQGKTRKEAEEMLADAVQEVVHRPGFTVQVARYGTGDEVSIAASDPAALAAYVLRYQREVNELSLADVAVRLGASSRNSYASYEQGRTEPTIGKLEQLLAAVAPGLAIIVGPRSGQSNGDAPAPAPKRARAVKRRSASTRAA